VGVPRRRGGGKPWRQASAAPFLRPCAPLAARCHTADARAARARLPLCPL